MHNSVPNHAWSRSSLPPPSPSYLSLHIQQFYTSYNAYISIFARLFLSTTTTTISTTTMTIKSRTPPIAPVLMGITDDPFCGVTSSTVGVSVDRDSSVGVTEEGVLSMMQPYCPSSSRCTEHKLETVNCTPLAATVGSLCAQRSKCDMMSVLFMSSVLISLPWNTTRFMLFSTQMRSESAIYLAERVQ